MAPPSEKLAGSLGVLRADFGVRDVTAPRSLRAASDADAPGTG